MLYKRGIPILSILLSCSSLMADEIKQCMILSGDSEYDYVIDLDRFNRVSFGPESMIFTNSGDPESSVELLYSAYSRLRIGDANPAVSIDEVEVNNLEIRYLKSLQSIIVKTNDADAVKIGVFNLAGTLVINSQLRDGESLSVEPLAPGAYVVIGVTGNDSKSIKFVK